MCGRVSANSASQWPTQLAKFLRASRTAGSVKLHCGADFYPKGLVRAGRVVRSISGDKAERLAASNPELSLLADGYHFP